MLRLYKKSEISYNSLRFSRHQLVDCFFRQYKCSSVCYASVEVSRLDWLTVRVTVLPLSILGYRVLSSHIYFFEKVSPLGWFTIEFLWKIISDLLRSNCFKNKLLDFLLCTINKGKDLSKDRLHTVVVFNSLIELINI